MICITLTRRIQNLFSVNINNCLMSLILIIKQSPVFTELRSELFFKCIKWFITPFNINKIICTLYAALRRKVRSTNIELLYPIPHSTSLTHLLPESIYFFLSVRYFLFKIEHNFK